MASSKKTFTTAKGIAVYPHLNRPDYQFNTDGVYTTKLRVPADQAKQLMDTLRKRTSPGRVWQESDFRKDALESRRRNRRNHAARRRASTRANLWTAPAS